MKTKNRISWKYFSGVRRSAAAERNFKLFMIIVIFLSAAERNFKDRTRTRFCHSIIFDSICVVLVCHSLFHFLSVLESLHRKYDRNFLVVHMWSCHQRAEAKTRDEKERKHAKMWMGSVQKFRAFAENKQFISSFSTSACWHVKLDEIVNTFYHILIISLVLRCEKGVWNREPFFFEKGLCFKKRAHIEVKSRGSRAA